MILAFTRQGDYYKFESKLGYMVVSEATLGYQRDPFSNRKQHQKFQMRGWHKGPCTAALRGMFKFWCLS